MKRNFKFRAWSIGRQRWVRFGLHNVPYWVHDAEVFQFTGLKDQNGNPIYEGDICEVLIMPSSPDTENYTARVVYKDGAFLFDDGKNDLPFLSNLTYESYTNGYHPLVCEVIGNVFENPELLQKDGDTN